MLQPGVRCSHYAPDGKLIENLTPEVNTTHEALVHGIKVSGNGDCLGRRLPEGGPYTWCSYQQLYDNAQRFGSSLIRHGAKPSNKQFIGIMSLNCYEWAYTEQACAMFSMVVIPLYDTMGEDSIRDILHKTELMICICYTVEHAHLLLKLKENITFIYIIQDFKDENSKFLSFSKELVISESNLEKPVPAKSDDICTICFTSGTTSQSKGVLITHRNLISIVSSVIITSFIGEEDCCMKRGDIHISYLPMAHLFERSIQIIFLMLGQKIGFFRGDIQGLFDDIQKLRPTHFVAVPRILNKIFNKVQSARLELSFLKRVLFDFAMSRKESLLSSGIVSRSTIWDYFIFNKLQAMLGNNVRIIISGSAPLSPDVHKFLRCAFGCPVLEGYGMTESTVATSFCLNNHHTNYGTVGAILPCNIVKLIDVAEMEYIAELGKGEICFRGPNQTKGYYHDEKSTNEAIDSDGWLHTGDIGQFNADGSLTIIDRIKFAFKLSQGEYIASEKCENVCLKSPYINQMFYDGNSNMDKPVAIVVPDENSLMLWSCKQSNMQNECFEKVCKLEQTKTFLLEEIQNTCKGHLKGFEIVCNILVESTPFSVNNHLLTATFKMKRSVIRKQYRNELSTLYK